MLIEGSIENLKTEVTLMARKAEEIFARAVPIIHTRDVAEINAVRQLDKAIDEMEINLDNACMELLLKEPYAIDFRYVFSITKTLSQLERIGDQAKTIAKWSPKLPEGVPADMDRLVEKTNEALQTAITALVEENVEQAERVMQLEFQVDEIEDRIIESTNDVAEAFIAKALERIGDLATNIAEQVIFFLSARDIRHGGFEEPGKN